MEVRFKFSADVCIEGADLAEIVSKFESMPLFSQEAMNEGHADDIETLLVEDADTYEDLMDEYNELY